MLNVGCITAVAGCRQSESVTYGLPGNATALANVTGPLNATGSELRALVEPVTNATAPYDFLLAATPGGPNTPSNSTGGAA